MIATNTRNSVSDVASLMRLSPEITVMMRLRQAQATADGCRGHGVGRRDDRAEQQRTGKGERRHDEEGDGTDRDRRDQHEPDAQPPDLRQALPEVDERDIQRGRVQQRREHEVQQQLAVDLDVGHRGMYDTASATTVTSSGAGQPRQRATAATATAPTST